MTPGTLGGDLVAVIDRHLLVRCFLLMASSFLRSAPVFHAGSPSKIVPTPYICRDGLPLSFSHFWLSTFDSSCLLVVSSLSSI